MRRKLKKLTPICLVVIMIVSMLTVAPFTAGAVITDCDIISATSGDFEYEVIGDGIVSITGYNGSATELEIPSTLDGYTVTSIGSYAFSYCTSLTSISLPKSVISIGYSVFSECINLENVDLSFGLISIGGSAFYGCIKLKKISIPDSVHTFDDYGLGTLSTFAGCSSLEEVSLSKNIDTIGRSMFRGCTNLKSISIPTNVNKICNSAFKDCASLTEIIIPDNVKEIEFAAFSGCINLESITLSNNIIDITSDVFENTYWYNSQSDGVIYLGNVLYSYKGEMPENTSIKVLEGTRIISGGCFRNYENLEDITIPDSVINIGSYALNNTAWLEKQTEGIVYAGKVAYSYKGELVKNSTLEFKNGTKGVAGYFHNSVNVDGNINVIFPESMVCIGSRAFGKISFHQTTDSSLDYLVLPNNLQYICSGAFSYCLDIKNEISLPDTIQYIGENAFFACNKIGAVYFPNSNFQIQAKAFGYTFAGYNDNLLLRNFKIYGYAGTDSETYAKENGIPFISFGDVNGDGKISIDDVTDIQKYVANMLAFTDEQEALADVDKDRKVSIDDVTLIQKYLAGMATI